MALNLTSAKITLGTAFVTGSPSSLAHAPTTSPALIFKRSAVENHRRQVLTVQAASANDDAPAGLSRRELFSLAAMSAMTTALADGLGLTNSAMAATFPGPQPALLNPVKYGSAQEQAALRSLAAKVLDPLIDIDPTAKGNAGALVRLAFHDAFTRDATGGGANASIRFERERRPNTTLDKAFAVVEDADRQINKGRKVPLSLADLYQIAGAQAIEKAGGPKIVVPIGRSDSANGEVDPDGLLPGPFSSVEKLLKDFSAVSLDDKDLVALSGAHTIGLSRNFVKDKPLDTTPASFDNAYFNDLLTGGGVFDSDKNLLNDPGTKALVEIFAKDKKAFFTAFNEAYIKLSLVGWTLPEGFFPACLCPASFDYERKVLPVNGKCSAGAFPNDQGFCPDANGQYPNAAGQYPDCNGRYPDSAGNYPDCNGRYADSRGFYPDAAGRYPN